MGRIPAIIGKRAVVVLVVLEPVVTRLNSGEYWKNNAGDPAAAIDAGLTRLSASKSAIPPPTPSARALSSPVG
jgi:hypothetical protein